MLAEKQKIEALLDIMSEHETKKIWKFIQDNFTVTPKYPSWEDIEIDSPTNEEKIILAAIDDNDTDFISQGDLLRQLDISPDEILKK